MLMTMDCPRCGFNQPKDRFCASCGLDVEEFAKRPAPLHTRILASPKLYVTAIGALALFLIVFIVRSKGPRLFQTGGGEYLSSREAADPSDQSAGPRVARAAALASTARDEPNHDPDDSPEPVSTAAVAAAVAPKPAPARPERIETEFFELRHDQTAALVSAGERIGEDSGGRAVLLHDEAHVRDVLRAGGRPIGPGYREPLRDETQSLIETPAGAGDGLRFGLMIQLASLHDDHAKLKFKSSFAGIPPETEAERRAGPSFRPLIEQNLGGAFELAPGDVLLVVFEPVNRRPRAEFLNKAGPGPWAIFNSPNFAVGETDWVATVRLTSASPRGNQPVPRVDTSPGNAH